MMKKAVNFRLHQETILMLSTLESSLQMSRTAIVEAAIECYAKKKLKKQASLMSLAGSLPSDDADELLKLAKSSKKNKKLQSDL